MKQENLTDFVRHRIRVLWTTPTVLFMAILAILPLFIRSRYYIHLLILGLIYAIVASGYDFTNNYTGIFTFGQQAFFAIGAYTSAILSIHVGVPPGLGVLFGGIIAALFGLIVATPTLRLRGVYTALVTLGSGEIIRLILLNEPVADYTKGPQGLWGIPFFKVFGVVLTPARVIASFYLIFIITAILLLVKHWLVNSKIGLAVSAIRESEDAAESLGVDSTRYKLFSFSVGAFYAGVAGAFYAHYLALITPSMSSISFMIQIMAMTLIGGTMTILGPVIGAIGVTLLTELLRPIGPGRLVIYGTFIIVVTFFFRGGLMTVFQKINERLKPHYPAWLKRDMTEKSDNQ